MTRYRFIEFWTTDGYLVEIQTREEHVDHKYHWQEVFKTECYSHPRSAIKRAKIWVSQNLPGAVE